MPEHTDDQPIKTWRGRFLEDFTVGDIYRHIPSRTVLAADNSWFTLLTQTPRPFTSTGTSQRRPNGSSRSSIQPSRLRS